MLGQDGERPRLAVVSTAHLDDGERLFVTALLLDKVKTWMRRQGGTTALRALVYMDEVFGYFPPHPANPPTKRPLLTLLKQARAQGVGVVLATQNPVDLDYKGLANMGTWLVGTLQTQQDRERLRERPRERGARGRTAEKLLGATKKRVFLLHDVHRKRARARAVALGDVLPARAAHARGDRAAHEGAGAGRARRGHGSEGGRDQSTRASGAVPPLLSVAPRRRDRRAARAREVRGALQGQRRVDRGDGLAARRREPLEALEAEPVAVDEKAVTQEAPAGIRYGDLPAWLGGGAKELERALKARLPDKLTQAAFHDPVTGETSRPGRDAPGVRGPRSRATGAATRHARSGRSSRRSRATSRGASRRSRAGARRSGWRSARRCSTTSG